MRLICTMNDCMYFWSILPYILRLKKVTLIPECDVYFYRRILKRIGKSFSKIVKILERKTRFDGMSHIIRCHKIFNFFKLQQQFHLHMDNVYSRDVRLPLFQFFGGRRTYCRHDVSFNSVFRPFA